MNGKMVKSSFCPRKNTHTPKNEKWKTQFLLINQRTVVEEVKWYFSYLDRWYMKLSIENMEFGHNLEEIEQAVETGGQILEEIEQVMKDT